MNSYFRRRLRFSSIPIDRILEFANKEYGEKARQRIAEDLVELLSSMGHDPYWEVTLGLKSSDGTVEYLKIRMREIADVLIWGG